MGLDPGILQKRRGGGGSGSSKRQVPMDFQPDKQKENPLGVKPP